MALGALKLSVALRVVRAVKWTCPSRGCHCCITLHRMDVCPFGAWTLPTLALNFNSTCPSPPCRVGNFFIIYTGSSPPTFCHSFFWLKPFSQPLILTLPPSHHFLSPPRQLPHCPRRNEALNILPETFSRPFSFFCVCQLILNCSTFV